MMSLTGHIILAPTFNDLLPIHPPCHLATLPPRLHHPIILQELLCLDSQYLWGTSWRGIKCSLSELALCLQTTSPPFPPYHTAGGHLGQSTTRSVLRAYHVSMVVTSTIISHGRHASLHLNRPLMTCHR